MSYIQFGPVFGDRDATLAKISRLAPPAGESDLIVLPELANTGYRFRDRSEALGLAETPTESPYLSHLASLCARRGFHAVSGFCERAGDDLYNSAVLVGPDGLAGIYRKVHLFVDEFDIFRPGDAGFPVFRVGDARIGMLVCFDWVFPEAWRSLALAGADLVCHPSNLVLPGFAQKAIPVHSLTNGYYVVTANRVGTERDLTFTGLSVVAGPRGEILCQAGEREEGAATVEIDLARARDKWITTRNHLLNDRRPESYVR